MIALTIAYELTESVTCLGSEEPYAFALIQGQRCNYLGYAVATESALTATVAKYIANGYRYHGDRNFADADAIRTLLRWSNPDDGWHYREFFDADIIARFLAMHNHDDDSLRSACIDQLKIAARLQKLTLGVTYGVDPNDFRDSVIQIYGPQGHKRFAEEYQNMTQLFGDVRKA